MARDANARRAGSTALAYYSSETRAVSDSLSIRTSLSATDRSIAEAILPFAFLALSLGLVGPAGATYTPAMAKRLAPGPFDAAPNVQGGWADGSPSDTLLFAS